jgi:hypothetical protein
MILLWCSTSVDHNSQNVLFTLQFRGAPNFYNVDASDRQEDSFQLYIFAAPQPDDAGLQGGYANVKGIIRGEEIHHGAGLPIRNVFQEPGSTADPANGGWGSIRTTLPFVQNGKTVFYIASLAALGVDGNNVFGFGFETYHYGATQGFIGRCASNSICRRRRQLVVGGRLPKGSSN